MNLTSSALISSVRVQVIPCEPPLISIYLGSGNVGRIDIILVLLWLMTFEALFDDIRHYWLLGISSRPELKAPTTRRRIFFCVLCHEGQTFQGALHVSAVDHRKLVQVGQEHGPVVIWPAFPERKFSHRIDVDVVHSAQHLKQWARLVDDHSIDVKPLPVTDACLEVVDGFSGYRESGEHSDCCGKQTKYPPHLSAGFGVSHHAPGKLSLFSQSPSHSSPHPFLPTLT